MVLCLSKESITNEELAERAKNGETECIKTLWENIKPLLLMYSYKYYNAYTARFSSCGVTLEDMEQECYFILLKMIEAYQKEKPYKFNTYANYQFKSHLRSILKIGDNYTKEPLNSCISLSEPLPAFDNDNATVEDSITDETAELAFTNNTELVFMQQLRTALNKAMSEALTPEQIRVIVERFYNNQTIAETGRITGVTASQARTIEAKSLKELRRYNNRTAELESFRNEIITTHAYHATGLTSFRYNMSSSVELALERAEREERRYNNRTGL